MTDNEVVTIQPIPQKIRGVTVIITVVEHNYGTLLARYDYPLENNPDAINMYECLCEYVEEFARNNVQAAQMETLHEGDEELRKRLDRLLGTKYDVLFDIVNKYVKNIPNDATPKVKAFYDQVRKLQKECF